MTQAGPIAIYVVVHLSIAFLTSWIAKKKGLSQFTWAIFGILCWPMALFWLALMTPKGLSEEADKSNKELEGCLFLIGFAVAIIWIVKKLFHYWISN